MEKAGGRPPGEGPEGGISAVVITHREEDRIRRCLDSLKDWVDEIIVVDDESADGTARIAAEEYGARVIVHPLGGAFDRQRNIGLEAARKAWVLQMDADEVVPPESVRAIRTALAEAEGIDGFTILRRDCVFDVPLTYRGSRHQVRIVRRGKGRNVGAVHEELVVDGAVGRIEAAVLHYNFSSVASVLEKNNRYTELEARRFLDEHGEVSYRFLRDRILFKTPALFYKHYVKNRARCDGVHGFIRAVMNTLHPLLIWLKVLEFAVKEGRLKDADINKHHGSRGAGRRSA